MLIEFQYRLPAQLANLMQTNISGFSGTYITAWVNSKDSKFLRNRSLFLICESTNEPNEPTIMYNPIGIVAKTDYEAVATFAKCTGKNNGMLHSKLLDRCNNIKVIPTGRTI